MQEEEPTTPTPRHPLLSRRVLIIAAVILVAVVLYGLSAYNSRKFFLIVEAGRVRVAKGRLLPFGTAPFIPRDPRLLKAYRSVSLPSGMQLPEGASTFTDRVQLDQALYRLIKDAVEYALQKDDARAQELTGRYLDQIDALPSLNKQQRASVLQLRRDAGYIVGRNLLNEARALLEKADDQFRASAEGDGSRFSDGLQKAALVRQMLLILDSATDAASEAEPPTPPIGAAATPTPKAPTSPAPEPAPPAPPLVAASTTATLTPDLDRPVELTP